jgi:hypothetical protein
MIGGFEAVRLEAEESWIGRMLAAVAVGYHRAWPASRTWRAAAAVGAALPHTRTEQLRYTALAGAAMTAGVAVISAVWVPDSAASGLPWFWPVFAAAFFVGLAAAPDGYLRAWPHSRLGRLIRACW